MAIKNAFSRANPNSMADLFRKVDIGALLRAQIPQVLHRKTPVANASCLATLQAFTLPDDCKAADIIRAYARATTGAGTLGALAIQAPDATPIDGQIAVAPNGDIVVLAASLYTQVDVEFIPARGDVMTFTNQEVVANVWTIPAAVTARGVVHLIRAVSIAGTPGQKVILTPGAGGPAAGQARLNLAKSTVTFAAADAVTSATITLLVAPLLELDTVLETTTDEPI